MSGGSFYRDRLICVVPDIGHTLIDIRGDTFRDTCFSGTLTEIQKHDILELIDFLNCAQLFTLLNVIVYELVCFFDIHTARDCTHDTGFYYSADKEVFGMPQGCACHLPFLEGSTGGREKFLQGVCIPILDYLIQFQFKIVGVMNISFFLIFYHLIRLLVKALQCELVIFQKELFCGDSLVVDALMEKYQIIGKLCLTKQGDCIEQFCVLFPVL